MEVNYQCCSGMGGMRWLWCDWIYFYWHLNLVRKVVFMVWYDSVSIVWLDFYGLIPFPWYDSISLVWSYSHASPWYNSILMYCVSPFLWVHSSGMIAMTCGIRNFWQSCRLVELWKEVVDIGAWLIIWRTELWFKLEELYLNKDAQQPLKLELLALLCKTHSLSTEDLAKWAWTKLL